MYQTKLQTIALNLLSPAKYNPRSITDKAKKGLEKSILEFGLVQLIVVNEREFSKTGLKNMIVFGGNYFTDFLPPSRCWLIWDKKVAKGMSFARGEMAWTSFDKNMDIYEITWAGNLDGKVDLKVEGLEKEVLNGSSRVVRTHPTQKPVSLFNQIILDFDFDTYFDGFNGGGTTFMSCIQNKKNYIGVEILPVYVEATLRRVVKYLENNQIKFEVKTPRGMEIKQIINNI